MSKIYYFDSDATHPPFYEVLQQTLEEYKNDYFNPSGITKFSLQRQKKINQARNYIANLTQKKLENFVFHSSSTEAIHFILFILSQNIKNSLLVSPFEHSCVYAVLEKYQIEYDLLLTSKDGLIVLGDVEKKIAGKKGSFLWISPVASETGVLQPMNEIEKIAKNQFVFSDLTQTICKINLDYSIFSGFVFSGHKIGAGLGCAVSYLDFSLFSEKKNLLVGGFQENSRRASTENTEAIINLQKVLKIQKQDFEAKIRKLQRLKSQIEKTLEKLNCEIIAQNSKRVCSTIFFLLPFDAENIDFFIIAMEERNIILSTGSSCKSRTREPSRSLLSMGYSKDESLRSIRISLNYFTTEEEVDYLNQSLEEVIEQLK